MSGKRVTHAEVEAVERLIAERELVGTPIVYYPAADDLPERTLASDIAGSPWPSTIHWVLKRRRRWLWHRFCIWAASR